MVKILFIVVIMQCMLITSYGQDINDLKRKADKGDNAAQVELGFRYLNGDGVTQNYEMAKGLFFKNAVGIHSPISLAAGFGLSLCYYNEEKYNLAFPGIRDFVMYGEIKGMEQQDIALAHYLLSQCYFYGLGTKENRFAAMNNIISSAKAGNEDARKQLLIWWNVISNLQPEEQTKIINEINEGVSVDPAYFSYVYSRLFAFGVGVKKDTEKAFQYKIKSAENGYEDAAFELVNDYYTNKDSEYLDYTKASLLLQQMAENNDPWAEWMLGYMYKEGLGISKNVSSAVSLMTKSTMHNYPSALYDLATWYYMGECVEKNYKKAIELYQRYDANRYYKDTHGVFIDFSSSSDSVLGNMYYDGGYGIEKDRRKAVCYFLKAAETDNILGESARKLAICYKWGYGGLLKDENKALEWMEKAKNLKDEIAEIALSQF